MTTKAPTAIALAIAGALASISANAQIFISEYIEGSSNNKALEFYNPTDNAIDLSDYSVAYYFNGSTSAGTNYPLIGTIAPQSTHVVVNAGAYTPTKALAQQLNSFSWYNGDDAIVLSKDGEVIDSIGQVGVDPGSFWGTSELKTQNLTLRRIDGSPRRTDITSAYNPSVYFTAAPRDDITDLGQYSGGVGPVDPNPNPEPTLTCADPATPIHSIQGATAQSPLKGQNVVVEAVVSADFQAANQLRGFFLSSLVADDNAATSEGIFVYNTEFDVNVGDIVRLSATVDEYYDATQLKDVDALVNCGTTDVTATEISLPVASTADLEAYEGMLVRVSQPLYVIDHYNLARYGEVGLASERLYQGTQVAMPGDAANAHEAQNQLKQLLLDDGSTQQNPEVIPYPAGGLDAYNTLRLGDSVSGLTGVLGYSFNQYRLHPTDSVQFIANNPRVASAELSAHGDFKVASFNVLNYFNGDGMQGDFPTPRGADSVAEFERQQHKLVSAITALDADIIGLMEIENDGFGANSALASLVNALNKATAQDRYAYVHFGTDQIGTDQITTALIYRRDRIIEKGTPAINDQGALSYGNRAAIAQSFQHKDSKEVITVAVAHLKSKGGCRSAQGLDADQNDGQACYNATRVAGATEFSAWLATKPTGVNDDDIIIVGDMNAYAKEDPISAFADAGYANVIPTLDGDTLGYSYNFQGRLGSLDHALASPSLMNKVIAATDWHINADEPRVLDYNVEFKSDSQQASLYAPHAYRASDHDPVIVAIDAAEPVAEEAGEYTNISGWFWPKNYTIEIPAGFDYLDIELEGGWGDVNLYVSHQRRPSVFKADCESTNSGANQLCQFENPEGGKWKVRLIGATPYGDVTLRYRALKF
ncbi:ExeM/NucH family extracellular endonuclease [Pseudoalteromonas sp. SSDWG2]|uniref:ExeM/NucH family extracellular endonuclease n=1 Tax=Pseudoalteromonas sp. SSDWG2 TaxID=3139391 RepID=UPI003BAD8B85